jgi:hypothetical protein
MPSDALARVPMPPEPSRLTTILTAYHPDERLLAVVEPTLPGAVLRAAHPAAV